MRTSRWGAVTIAVVTLAFLALPARSQAPAGYTLEGQTIRFVLTSSPAEPADIEMRLLMDAMLRYLPGSPRGVPQNVDGAGGVRALEFVRQLDPAELVVVHTASAIPFRGRVDDLSGNFDPHAAHWIGSFVRATTLCYVSTASGITSVDDIRLASVRFGGQSATGTQAAYLLLLKRALGLEFTTVFGYDSFSTVALAVSRGEIEGGCAPYSALPALLQPMIDAGSIRLLLYLGGDRRDDLDIPHALDLPLVAAEEEFVRGAFAALAFSRPIFVPAGADPAFVEAIRAAFAAATADPDFIAQAATLGIDLDIRTGAEIAAMVDELYAMPDPLAETIRAFLFP